MSKSESLKEYWNECEKCHRYHNGKKVHRRVCYDCGECTREGKPLFSEIYNKEPHEVERPNNLRY